MKHYYHCHSKSLVLPLQKYVVIIILCIRHSRLIIGFVTRVTRLVSHVEQELFTVPVHPSSPPGFRGVRFPRSLYFCVMFYRSLCPFFWSLCCLSFDLQLLITTLVCGRTSRNICYYVKKWWIIIDVAFAEMKKTIFVTLFLVHFKTFWETIYCTIFNFIIIFF